MQFGRHIHLCFPESNFDYVNPKITWNQGTRTKENKKTNEITENDNNRNRDAAAAKFLLRFNTIISTFPNTLTIE